MATRSVSSRTSSVLRSARWVVGIDATAEKRSTASTIQGMHRMVIDGKNIDRMRKDDRQKEVPEHECGSLNSMERDLHDLHCVGMRTRESSCQDTESGNAWPAENSEMWMCSSGAATTNRCDGVDQRRSKNK